MAFFFQVSIVGVAMSVRGMDLLEIYGLLALSLLLLVTRILVGIIIA